MIYQTELSNMKNQEVKKIVSDFYVDDQRLTNEWKLCDSKYKEIQDILFKKETTYTDMQMLRKVSDYWNQRKLALERAMPVEFVYKLKGK